MKKRIYFFMTLLIALTFGLLNISPVYAEENFGNEECISDDSWSTKAKTDYSIDESSGKFVTSGLTAEQYRAQSNVEPKFVFYDVSEDGKTITAYIDNYQTQIKVEEIKKIIEEAGITVTSTCDHVLKVSKTLDENVPNNNESNTNSGSEDINEGTGTDDAQNTVEKIESPNTASPASLLAVSVGAILVVGSVYVILNKNNKNSKSNN